MKVGLSSGLVLVIVDPGGRDIGVTEPLLDLGDVAGFDIWPNPLERFVDDSLERAGFEPPVPLKDDPVSLASATAE